MKEQDVAHKLESYREALGDCSRTPLRRSSHRRYLALVPIAVIAACAIAFAVWPRDAKAATFRQLGLAISNAKTMESRMYFEEEPGKYALWQRVSYASGRWRMESVAPGSHPVTLIFRDGLFYEDYDSLDHATVRPAELAAVPPPTQGEALEVVKEQLTRYFSRGSTLRLGSSLPVNGRPAYRVMFVRPDRPGRIEIVVDEQTDLPIFADSWNDQFPKQHVHWDYQFNVPVPSGFFDLKPGRKLIDLRKTMPAFVAAQKPIATVKNFTILDACMTSDGIVWLSTIAPNDPHDDFDPGDFQGWPGVHYAEGIELVAKLIGNEQIHIYGFAPLDPPPTAALKPGMCSVDVRRSSRPQPIPNSDDMYAGEQLDVSGKVSFPVRSERSKLPKYFDDLGMEERLVELPFHIDRARAVTLEGIGRFGEAAKIYESFARESGPHFGAYFEWMRHASECYRKAGQPAQAASVDAEAARFRP